MSHRIVTLHKAYETDCEGVGRDQGAIGYYTSAGAADDARKGNPYSGVREVKALEIDFVRERTYYLLADADPILVDVAPEVVRAKRARESGLSKLTHEEKIALGLL